MITTVDSLEQAIQDFIDECSEHENCEECPCMEFCSRFDYGDAMIAPEFWHIREKYRGVPC